MRLRDFVARYMKKRHQQKLVIVSIVLLISLNMPIVLLFDSSKKENDTYTNWKTYGVFYKIIVIWLSHNIKRVKKRRKFGISWPMYYIQATLFILKKQNPLSSPIFSFKASLDFIQGLGLLSLISRYSSIFKAFSMILSKRKRPHRTVFPLYKVFIFSLFYSFPRLKIFAPWG